MGRGASGERSAGVESRWFALCAYPGVLGIRFATKVALVWLLGRAEFGEVAYVGLLSFLFGHLGCFGLDEVVVSRRHVDAGLLRALRRFQLRWGGVLVVGFLVVGLSWAGWRGSWPVAWFVVALSPLIPLAQRSVLPTALLVRAQRYRALFTLDVSGVVAMSAVVLLSAALGAGGWSLVFGWYANAIVVVWNATRLAAPMQTDSLQAGTGEPSTPRESSLHAALADGRRFLVADLQAYGTEKADALVVGAMVDRATFGLYEMSSHVATATVQCASHLGERMVLPLLAQASRDGTFRREWRQVLAWTAGGSVVVHAGALLLLVPLLSWVFPDGWQGAPPLIGWLLIASSFRVVDVVASAGLKALGESALLVRWTSIKLVLAAVGCGVAAPWGLVAVAWVLIGVFALAAFGTACSVWLRARALVR